MRHESPRSSLRTTAAALLSGVLTATALTAVTTIPAAAAAEAPTVRVWITKYRNIKMPNAIRPGVHRFVVRSAKSSGFQIARARPGYTKLELKRDVRRGLEQGKPRAFKRFERNIELRGGVPSGPGDRGVMWARLRPGTYWAVDTNGPALARKIETFHVAGAPVRGRLPGAKILVASGEHDWANRPLVIPNSGRLRFYNPSGQSHFIDLVRLLPGKTVADFAQWIEGGFQGPPPVDFDRAVSSGVLDSGRVMSLKYRLPPGNYILACFWPDPDEQMTPHALMGMYRQIRLR